MGGTLISSTVAGLACATEGCWGYCCCCVLLHSSAAKVCSGVVCLGENNILKYVLITIHRQATAVKMHEKILSVF
jgi:hypothetical protein